MTVWRNSSKNGETKKMVGGMKYLAQRRMGFFTFRNLDIRWKLGASVRREHQIPDDGEFQPLNRCRWKMTKNKSIGIHIKNLKNSCTWKNIENEMVDSNKEER